MPDTEVDYDYDAFKYPKFHLPYIVRTPSPSSLPWSLTPEFYHKDREHKLLSHLWHVQLGKEQLRHHWNIQALHEFWRENGPPTFEGRRYGWSPTWIVDALSSLKEDLEGFQRVADRAELKRVRMQNQAKQVLGLSGIELKDEGWVSDGEIKLAVKPARGDVVGGQRECLGGEAVLVKKIVMDKEKGWESFRVRDKKDRETMKDAARRNLEKWRDTIEEITARRGNESNGNTDFNDDDETPRHTPLRRPCTLPVTPPDRPAVNTLETARKASKMVHHKGEEKGRQEQSNWAMGWHNALIRPSAGSPFSNLGSTRSRMMMDVKMDMSDIESGSGRDPMAILAVPVQLL
ncbi:uncharacterized protein PADG_06893 [Paracoccidioides brasiliensis Pb18]|uniref:Uncharacterized protein n=1 Tax=Paracoccidioides brasiliensis (strain Pb18) TaxID=502780 RepID=C1GI07_PARBD|nr:uncharacterized protein PADG_06893 [Paracoccidioides brasiliensis Pb18]EEH50814.1 hypothetical protein PADG_06893 [Paracoccidioides brasiliensis Pb18]